METLNEYAWIGIVIILGWICYRLWKAGMYRDPGQEDTYYKAMRKQTPYKCPYDPEGRSCTYYNNVTRIKKVDCRDCSWYNNGVRPSKF